MLERGLTGRNGVDCWDPEIYAVWAQRFRGANVGVRAPMGVVGIDVDMYKDKQGAATLAAAEAEWGTLPATWHSTSRQDGSAIRWFRVPLDLATDFEALSVLPQGAGVELIDHGYRYAVVAPSIHPDTGEKYRWLDADGIEVESPPRPEGLPELPRPWAEGLSTYAPQPLPRATEAEGNAYLDGLPNGEMSAEVAMAVVGMLEDFQIKGCRNPSMNSGVFALLQNSGCGEYTGVPTALKLLRKAYVDALAGDRGEQVAAKEFDKTVADGSQAGAAVAGQLAVRIGAFGPGGLWNPKSPKYFFGEHSADEADADGEPDDPEDDAPGGPPSWAPVDVAAARTGQAADPPAVLARADGARLFYAGKVHSVHGESESGKSWLVQCAAAECLLAGESVLYVDFEDDAAGVANRLLLLGVPAEIVDDVDRFVYVRPEMSLGPEVERNAFESLLSCEFAFAVVDGVTDSMGLFGYSNKDNDDIAAWQRRLPRAIARRTGAAVACVDHVSRDADGRGRFALGGQHKIAGLDGAALIVEMEQPFAVGLAGMASVRVGKDRPGQIRNLGAKWRKSDRTQHIASFRLDSTDSTLTTWCLEVPTTSGSVTDTVASEATDKAAPRGFRPTWFMEQISKYWETTDNVTERSETKTVEAMCAERRDNGKPLHRNQWRRAIDCLVEEGYATWTEGARRSHLHTVVNPYRQAADPESDQFSHITADDVDRLNAQIVARVKS